MTPVLNSPTGEMFTLGEQTNFTQVNNVQAVKELVLSQNGIGILSDMMVESELENGSLLRLLPEWHVESMYLYAVWSAQQTTGQLVKKFVDFLSEEFEAL